MTPMQISLLVADYSNLRRKQTGNQVSDEELRGVYGFADFLVILSKCWEDLPVPGTPLFSEVIADASPHTKTFVKER